MVRVVVHGFLVSTAARVAITGFPRTAEMAERKRKEVK